MFTSVSRGFLFAVGIVLLSGQANAFQEKLPPKAGAMPAATKDSNAPAPDYSKEGFVIEALGQNVTFSEDGTGQEDRRARIRIQSDAAIRAFGVLTFPYRNAFERLEIVDIHVTKPDGSVISTPVSEAQDVPTEVTRLAPTYSDSREKQVPVKGLSVGDVLEWHISTIRTNADIPGQFYYDYNFTKGAIVLQEALLISVPAGKYVKVSSPKINPEIRRENGRVLYFWKTAQLEPPKDEVQKRQPELAPLPEVRLTSFRSWEEVGRWYGALQKSQTQITPSLQAKADELVRGLNTPAQKERAIYQFVATKFRYISVSLGEGRYQPHAADEVLANQYGDCKDKHTLLSTLLKAVGIASWPALIGAGNEFDPDLPSPAQFNHVITFIPGDGSSATWLDTTPEVAPFGMLQAVLRNRKALVISDDAAPSVYTTPDTLPFPAEQTIAVASQLDGDGTLTATFDMAARGDDEIIFKSAFHNTAPAQWNTLAQNIVRSLGFAGTVSKVSVDNPANTETPFHYSFSYRRETYSDWEHHRITPPIPPLGIEGIPEMKAPAEPLFIGALGKVTYRATIQLPAGFSVAIPGDAKLDTGFASYRSSYAADKGVLSVERTFVRKKSKVAPSEWEEYQKLAKAVITDESQFIALSRGAGGSIVTRNNAEANELIAKANQLLRDRDFSATKDALSQAERLNPQQAGLWLAYGYYYGMQNQLDRSAESLQKEIAVHPENVGVYQMLAATQRQLRRPEDAIQTLRLWVKAAPENIDASISLGTTLISAKRYDQVIEPLTAAVKIHPDNERMQIILLEAELHSPNQPGVADLLANLRQMKLDPTGQNALAYVLADNNTELALAQDLTLKAVTAWESQSRQSTLSSVNGEDLRRVLFLGAAWDTMGWVYLRNNDLAGAEKYLKAAWLLRQDAIGADHLGQLYEKQGKKDEAIHAYRLALAVQKNMPETRVRLEKLGASGDDPVRRAGPAAARAVSPGEELSQMRSVPVPGLIQKEGSAEFFVMFTPKGILEVRFMSGDEKLKDAANALSKISYDAAFPDSGPERIPRRGILSCSQYTMPTCNFVLLLPASTHL